MEEPQATLREIADTAARLKVKAVAARLSFLAYLLSLVLYEAEAELKRKEEA